MEKVSLTDVTGRDGFQMKKQWIETEDKARNGIIDAGITRIEATSFVSPKAIPQMKDAKEVISRLNWQSIEIIALVPNVKGTERALVAGVGEIKWSCPSANCITKRMSINPWMNQLKASWKSAG